MLFPSISLVLLLVLPPTLTLSSPAQDPRTNRLFLPSSTPPLDPLTCLPLPPSSPQMNPSTCHTHTIPSICAKLTFPFPPRGVWQWSVFPGCAMGFFLPATLARGQGVPTRERCVDEVFGAMERECAARRGRAGARNVQELPGRGSVGRARVPGRAMFLMVPDMRAVESEVE